VKGTLIFFNPSKRHGFIRTEEGERLLVQESGFEPGHLLGDRCAGTALNFERVEPEGAEEPQAVHVTVVQNAEPRRARMRRR
jgi:cold shock CspA family protein